MYVLLLYAHERVTRACTSRHRIKREQNTGTTTAASRKLRRRTLHELHEYIHNVGGTRGISPFDHLLQLANQDSLLTQTKPYNTLPP